ncbi:LD-carboxypeptidase [Latilactobacillus curvatus]|uniref:S66 family peptidase n=1 Tax=Latilactobacillus curvatus TaxID=28038 RepID=UPI0010AE3096|nr:S66 peptidase family protein [Latilactobacillus curvatus]TJY24277.1 LD-carboxypeptidase [Latilactobacillus curvatus]
MMPKRLSKGDEIRVIAPSNSLQSVGGYVANQPANDRLSALGYQVTFGQHVLIMDQFNSSPIEARIADLHAAFIDDNVKAILAVTGGYNSNELLPYIDFDLIASHPKIICGYSDFSALANAMTAKTGLITYYGPSYISFKLVDQLGDYQAHNWQKVMTQEAGPIRLAASKEWSSDAWYLPNAARDYQPNRWQSYTSGCVTGTLVGGNLNTLYTLQGTAYQPDYNDQVLLIECSDGSDPFDFSRNLAALLQSMEHPKALIIGRIPTDVALSETDLIAILNKFPILKTIPVLYNVNVGHTQPILTLPIGQSITVNATEGWLQIEPE